MECFVCNYCGNTYTSDMMIPNSNGCGHCSFKCTWCHQRNVTEPYKKEKPVNEFFERILVKQRK
ncbi:hypothetical protein N9948_00640 [bacterium]|nr:hypothetical protein [bacterium]